MSVSSNNVNKYRASIKRELKIDDSKKELKDYREVEDYLKTVSMRFLKEPNNIEKLDKAYTDIIAGSQKEKNEKINYESKTKSKKVEEKSIFYDIFIKPKENKIKEIRLKRDEQKASSTKAKTIQPKLFISNKTSEVNSRMNKFNLISSVNKSTNESGSSISRKESQSMELDNSKVKSREVDRSERPENNNQEHHNILHESSFGILLNFLNDKFVPSENSRKNFFNQLIQIRPPEGINATSASPLIDTNKGWAPSIPSISASKMKTNLNDLLMRAKGGIQAGDIPKEAHMAFFLGIMNEEEKKYEEALKFYKKYFLSAKLLQDVYGTELALNRIAVLYSNIFDFSQSLYYNDKHKDITTHNVNGFVAFYNSGVCLRILGRIDDSITNFNRALQMSEEENDLESYTLCICQLAISNLFLGNLDAFFEYAEEFYEKNRTLKHNEMDLEMLMINGYIHNFCGNHDSSKECYVSSLKQSTSFGNELYKAISLCNVGIVEGNKDFDDFLDSLN